jgi:hypothetical protein
VAAPIFNQLEVEQLLEMPKHAAHDAWEDRHNGRNEMQARVPVTPDDKSAFVQFEVEAYKCPEKNEASFTLIAKSVGRPEQAICRYEIHIGRHKNLRWMSPVFVGSKIPHKHIYNEKAVRDDWPWDQCAEPLKFKKSLPRKISLQQAIDRIAPIFLVEVHLEIYDPNVQTLFR